MKALASFGLLVLAMSSASAQQGDRFQSLKRDGTLTAHVGRQADGRIIVPTNQVLDPAGEQIEFPGRPFDFLLSPDERTLVVKVHDSVLFVDVESRKVVRSIPLKENSFHGIAGTKDLAKIFVSRSEEGIAVLQTANAEKSPIEKKISLPKKAGARTGPVPGGLALAEDGRTLLATFSRNNTLALIDLSTETAEEIPVGIAPYGVLVKDARAYVSNWAGRPPNEGDPTGPTSGSKMIVDPKTFAAASGTISVVDLAAKKEIASIEVGFHPSGMVINPARNRLFVTNANSDTISVIELDSHKVVETIPVRPAKELPYGSAPNAVEISPDGKTLFVASGSNNCIAVLELSSAASAISGAPEKSSIKGLIPTGWYPGAVKLDKAGTQLYIANIKGVGSLNVPKGKRGGQSRDQMGSISIIPVPNEQELASYTSRVHANNRMQWSMMGLQRTEASAKPVPVPLFENEKSVIKHVIYIIKENRTYDQILGDMPKGNGDKELCLFGAEVTPNHHALADQFTLFDNFYCSGILSADGHHWATAAYATDYLERGFGGWPRSYPYEGDDMLANSAGGFIWDKVLAKGLTFRDYGEMTQAMITPPGLSFLQIYRDFKEGIGKVKLKSTTKLKTIEPYICPNYIGFPGTVPDVMRADIFIKELKQFEANGNLPNFIVMLLPCDHTMGTKPGRPTPRACVADNDLGLGRIVEAVSHSKFWPETCIFATEDDPQAGLDHVDGHRTIAIVASPYVKRGYVDSTNYNQTGLLRTIELILGLSAMNQIDLSATPMAACFQDEPDRTPYVSVPNNIPIDEMNPDLTATKGKQRYWAKKSMEEDLDEVDEADEDTLNRIIWHSVKGYDVPYPETKNSNPERD